MLRLFLISIFFNEGLSEKLFTVRKYRLFCIVFIILRKRREGIVFHGYCYGHNTCVPSNLHVEALIPNVASLGVGLWERGLDEVKRVELLERNGHPYEKRCGKDFCGVRAHEDYCHTQVKKTDLTRKQNGQRLDLNFPASRTVRNKCLLFKPPSLWCSVIAAHAV